MTDKESKTQVLDLVLILNGKWLVSFGMRVASRTIHFTRIFWLLHNYERIIERIVKIALQLQRLNKLFLDLSDQSMQLQSKVATSRLYFSVTFFAETEEKTFF